jgi:hypothetical protein
MGKKVFPLLYLLFIISGAPPSFAAVFQTTDMAGNWYIYSVEVDMGIPAVYWVRGYFVVDGAGNITAGTYYAPDGSTVTLSSGQIGLNTQGLISGGFTAEGSTATIVHGKLDQGKTMGTVVLMGSDQTMDIVTFIKGGGTFVTSDLEGTWNTYLTIIDPSTGAAFWIYGEYTFDALGGVTTGFLTGPDGSTQTVTGGTLSVNSSGIVTGNINLSSGQKFTITHSKIDIGKTRAVGVSIEPDGVMAVAYMVKAGGIFEPADIASKSYAYCLMIDPSIPAVYWIYGDNRISESGNFKGSYTAPTGMVVNGTGTVTMDDSGLITGIVAFNTGDSGVGYFKRDQGKTSGVGVTVTTSGIMGIWQFFEGSSITLPALPMLLLND